MTKDAIAVLFANLKSNIGDFAILHAMLLELQRKFPGRTIDVFPLGFYQVDRIRLTAFTKECEVNFELAGKTYFREIAIPPTGQKFLRHLFLWPEIQQRLTRRLAEAVVDDAIRFRDYEAIFMAGGERGGGTKGGISLFATLDAVHHHNDRIYTFPFSVSPHLLNFNTKTALRQSFKKIQPPLLVRDSASKRFLDSIGVNSVLGSDCVFSLQDLANRVIKKKGKDSARVIFSIAVRRKKTAVELMRTLRNLVDSRFGIALLTTCELEDGEWLRIIAQDSGIEYLAPTTWQEAVAEFKSSSLIVTNRLHGTILGSLANTPLLVVTNRGKAKSFVEDARLPLSAPRISDVTMNLLGRCLGESQLLLNSAKAYQDRIRDRPRSPVSHISDRRMNA